ncbi:hypothetical protein Focb16_v001960 [Fusarium oxysporum f. sp. cubense]|uniref:Uncharacterized protein n=1 Tax=Fusarium oxysporum f. sp. cubense TaxID=61366 RepID=A0A559L7T5_FUSOC|nr:hypothetical protein Focb16_v001960 [Fusarium oxysporum f. sp. cubense]
MSENVYWGICGVPCSRNLSDHEDLSSGEKFVDEDTIKWLCECGLILQRPTNKRAVVVPRPQSDEDIYFGVDYDENKKVLRKGERYFEIYRTEDSEYDSESDSESESETTYLPYVIPSHAACYEMPLHG